MTWFVPLLLAVRRRALEARRQHRSALFVALSATAAVVTVVALALLGVLATALWMVGLWWLATAVGLAVAWAYFPWTLARDVAVPLGKPRLAAWLARRSSQFGAHRDGAAVVAAAWAMCRQREPSADDLVWVEAQRDAAGRVGDCEVLATGLLAAARGDLAGARALIESLALLPEVTPAARELAAEWLATADAAAGDWRLLLARSTRHTHPKLAVDPIATGLPPDLPPLARPPTGRLTLLWPPTTGSYLLEGVAQCLLDTPDAPGASALVLRWLEAPARLRTWPLVRRALSARDATAPPAAPPADAPAPDASGSDLFATAVARHVVAMCAQSAGVLGPRQVAAAAAAWDTALASADARTTLLARALDVGAPPDAGHRVLDELARTATDELVGLVLAAELPVAAFDDLGSTAPGSLLAACAQRVRHRLLSDLELTVSRTATRVAAGQRLPALDEWRELLALRAAHARACRIGGEPLRRLAFPHLHEELTRWGVGLWNDRGEHVLSDAITYWLLAEALAVGDAQAIDCHARNASLAIPARR